jgi:hypothetical protein
MIFECLDSNFCLNSIGLSVSKEIWKKKTKPFSLFPHTPFPFGQPQPQPSFQFRTQPATIARSIIAQQLLAAQRGPLSPLARAPTASR